ncbi:SHOCT domain-containing protein [Sphingobium yanoikuyae]|uniref:SHOCT domain-containing protein n=1 Tax=Sphingobium yanoikuyae TaxID=13690 RepID=UPI0028B1D4AF|nr:SHOCT domain-containing protein [Sphingobium yanoikuyae]
METLIGTTLKGQTKSIAVGDDAVTIIPRALYHGFVGEKRIPYSSITAVQFKEAGGWLAGFIQFSIKGAVEWRGQVNQDENALQFDKASNAEFHALRDFVQKQMASASALPIASMADELMKLAALRDQGILSDEEFATQKRKLLG